MTSIGIDLGSLNSVIAVARNRGVDIICNEVSNRFTPTLVSFGTKSRYIGESAKSQEIGNFRNTIFSLKNLTGVSVHDEQILQYESKFLSQDPLKMNESDLIGFPVEYLSSSKVFSAVEILAMFFGKLAQLAQVELQKSVTDAVISIPSFFTAQQRRAIIDSTYIAGFSSVRLISDAAAIALAWGMPKMDLSATEQKPLYVCFVDIGYSYTQISITAFSSSRAQVKAVTYDCFLGGRDYDTALAQFFSKELEVKGIDISKNKKAHYRLRSACEKTKKVLSANMIARISVESLVDDIDFSSDISRDSFESITIHLTERLDDLISKALEQASISLSDLYAVELVGGTTRINSIKTKLSAIFNRELSTTLNQDEAIAKGAALQAALISPQFKVRDYSIIDCVVNPVTFKWEADEKNPDDTGCLVFPVGNPFPSTKLLSFSKNLPFSITSKYETRDFFMPSQSFIGSANFYATDSMYFDEIKTKVRINPNGLVNVEAVTGIINDSSSEDKKTSEAKISFDWFPTGSLSDSILNLLREREVDMVYSDKLVIETADKRNELEEYLYFIKSKLEDTNQNIFLSKEEFSSLKDKLVQTEQWIFSDEGYDSTKSAYSKSLENLKLIGELLVKRIEESSKIESSFNQLYSSLNRYFAEINNNHEFSDDEKKQLVDKLTQKQNFINDKLSLYKSIPKYEILSKKTADALDFFSCILKEIDEIYISFINMKKTKLEQNQSQMNAENTDSTTSTTAAA